MTVNACPGYTQISVQEEGNVSWNLELLSKNISPSAPVVALWVFFSWFIGSWTILDVLWWIIVAVLQCPIYTLLCSCVVQLAVQCLCPRSCFSPSELQPSKPLQPFIFALPFCQMRHQLINTTLGFSINSWQACWPIIPLMNANGPSHSESHSDMDAHAPLNMHTHIWIRLSTSPLYYFAAMMKCRSWRPLARAAPEVGLTPAVSHRKV